METSPAGQGASAFVPEMGRLLQQIHFWIYHCQQPLLLTGLFASACTRSSTTSILFPLAVDHIIRLGHGGEDLIVGQVPKAQRLLVPL